jgi:tRNA dimethylallyltransferase
LITPDSTSHLPILAIGGPTAVGKSAAALALADALDGAGVTSILISADSRQVFRGFDIGTDKVSAEVRVARPHACIDIADASDPFTLYDWLDAARAAIAGHVQSHGGAGIAIVVGGTGLYQRGLLKGFLSGGARPSNPLIRAQLELQFSNVGREPLDKELRERNPAAADAVATASTRRLIRTLEIVRLGGDPLAEEESPWAAPTAYVQIDDVDFDRHRARITARVRAQFDQGLVEETEQLAARLPADTPALSGIGYREARAYIDQTMDRERAIGTAATRTWAYARRQRTWYRGESLAETIQTDGRPADEIARILLPHAMRIAVR